MDFKTKWYSPENKPLDIPTFQNLQDVTGQAFDEFGNYVGKTEVPNQQLVIDKLTERQYYAPKEYSDDALRYAKAKVDKSFKPEDWYGMTQIKPHYKIGEHISAGYITALKSFAKPVAMLPTQLVYAGSVGLNALAKGDLQKTENLYRYSMQNWSDTLDKHGLGADPELSNMLTAKVGSIAGQTASSLLIAATVSSVGGLPAVATVFGSTQFADVLEEGLEKGLPHDKAVLAAFLAAVPEGGLEAVGFKMWSGAASLNKTFRNLVLAFLWEGAQEGSQQIAESTITNLFKIREQTFFDIVADVALSALVGGLVGLGGAAISGQVEQRNIALKKEIGMTEQGNIVPQKPTDVKKSVPQKEGQVLNPSPEAEKQLIQQEIEEAKKTGDNKLYNTIKYVANANDVTDVDVIDKLYPICRKMIADGGTIDTLLDILGNQIVAYKNQLQSGQAGNQATQKAVEEIKLATDPNRYEEWKESRKSELEKAGFTKEQAGTLSEHISRIAQNLSNRLGFDITEKKAVSFEPNLKAKAGTRGQITLGKTIAKIALNENADPTTVEHEFFHYIDSVVKDAAKEGNKEAQKLLKKREDIIKKAKAELKKNGITKFPSDEEIIASAYEKWLWNGAKSEDATEQKLFESIRDFFRDVYQSITGLLGVRISPEADAYFKAMTGAREIVKSEKLYKTVDFSNTLYQEGIKYDSNGKADINSPEFKKWFGNSKVVDENGKPLVVYHNTRARFSKFDKSKIGANTDEGKHGVGFYFSDEKGQVYMYGSIQMPVYLRIKNPLTLGRKGKFETIYDYGNYKKGIPEINSLEDYEKYKDKLPSIKEITEMAKGDGYDGIIVRPLSGAKNEYIVFEPTQIKSVYNRGTFDTESPNIYYQSDNDLFATHNMNLAGAKQALRLGGLAMPSMAIRRTSTENTRGFGEVSFVANERLAAPKRGIEVYDRDAWTPSIWNNIKYSLSKQARTRIENILKKTGEEKKQSMYVYNIEENLYDATINELALDLYMKEKGLPDSSRGDLYDSPEYIKWYNETFMDDATPYLYTENDDNTDMVNRKLTLGNIMKVLRKKERAAGGYIGGHIFSVEELIKFFPQRFRNIKQVRAKKENLQNFEDIRKKIDDLDKDFVELVSSLRTEGKEKEYGSDRYAVGLAIINPNDKSYQKDRLEDAGLKSDDETIVKIDKFAERLKNEIPVEYFEVKPRRVVSFGEFSGVIMPNTQEYDALADRLKSEYNLPVLRIEKGNVAQYKEALNTIQNMYPTTFFQTTQEELFRNDQATKHGNKVLDKAPTNQEVEKELEAIRSGRVEEAQKAKRNLGLIDGLGDALLTVRQRVGVIDKRLKFAFDRMDFNEKMMESEYGKQALGYLKKYKKLSDVEKDELDYLLNNQQHERVREFMRDHDMLQEYTQVRKLLDNLHEEGNRAGMDMGFLEEYFPTKVADYKAFISHLMGTEKWSEIELALNQIDPNHQMSEEERSDAINSILRGYRRKSLVPEDGGKTTKKPFVGKSPFDPIRKQGFEKERKIFHKTPEMMKYYMRSDEALMRYISGMSSALAMRKAFNVKGAFNSEESIGAVVNELIRSGKITQKEEAFIKRMLKARLNYARTAPIVSLIKNFGYLGTMNNITSAVTQIGDLYAVFYKYNFPTAMKAIFGKADITKDDLYLDSIWEEFNKDNWSGVAVDKLFTAIGLNKLDKLGKNTAIDGAWIDLKERARKNDVSLLEDLTAAFGRRAGEVLADIKNNNVTFDVKQLLWTQLADTQPIGKSGVPVAYLNSPHMRVFYQLKTYTVNQLSLFYADGLYKIRKGIATKNKKLFLQGTGNIMKLALLLTVFNAGADILKNLIMGRSIEISDTLVSNLIWNLGVSKYTFYRGQRDGYARALVENFLPPQISMADDAFMDAKKIYKGNRKPSDTVAVTYVPYGRMWYWWFGGGRTAEKKKGNKPFQVKL